VGVGGGKLEGGQGQPQDTRGSAPRGSEKSDQQRRLIQKRGGQGKERPQKVVDNKTCPIQEMSWGGGGDELQGAERGHVKHAAPIEQKVEKPGPEKVGVCDRKNVIGKSAEENTERLGLPI